METLSSRPPLPLIFGEALWVRMSPLAEPNTCNHPQLRPLVKFKGEYETHYLCLVCGFECWTRLMMGSHMVTLGSSCPCLK